MKSADIIALLREQVDDVQSQEWTDERLLRILNQQMFKLFREQVSADDSYHNLELTLSAASATAVHLNQYVYTLPRWVFRVTWVRFKTETTEGIGPPIPRAYRPDSFRHGWLLDANKRLRLVGFGQAEDIILGVAKVPAKIHSGTLPAQTVTGSLTSATTQVRLDKDNDPTFAHESEPDAYRNAIIEITTAGKSGQIRRVTASTPNESIPSNFHTVLTVERPWTSNPVLADTYDLHAEVDDPLIRLLITESAQVCEQMRHNANGMAVLTPELMSERTKFQEHVKPRETMGVQTWREYDEAQFQRHDPDMEYPVW